MIVYNKTPFSFAYAIPPPYAMGEAKQKRFLSSPQN